MSDRFFFGEAGGSSSRKILKKAFFLPPSLLIPIPPHMEGKIAELINSSDPSTNLDIGFFGASITIACKLFKQVIALVSSELFVSVQETKTSGSIRVILQRQSQPAVRISLVRIESGPNPLRGASFNVIVFHRLPDLQEIYATIVPLISMAPRRQKFMKLMRGVEHVCDVENDDSAKFKAFLFG
jgi:hypothetical protein